jgi:hypothetical protein
MLSHVRKAITAAGDTLEATPGGRIPYSREEVTEILARRVMAKGNSLEHPGAPIVWHSAMGHQSEGNLQPTEVRINPNRPTGGTHDVMVPGAMEGSREHPILEGRRDAFHSLVLVIHGKYVMNVLILRLWMLVATRDFLLNGLRIDHTAIQNTIANSQISEARCLHALYDSERICMEAVKNCLKTKKAKSFFEFEDTANFLKRDDVSVHAKAVWKAVISQCKMDIIKQAAHLVYHQTDLSDVSLAERLVELTDDHGSFSLFGDAGADADKLNSTVLDPNGNPLKGERYMYAACKLVHQNGLVTLPFTQALVSERVQFCKNRISHIEATLSDPDTRTAAEFTRIETANEMLSKDTFGSERYKHKHDLEKRTGH